MQSLQSRIHLPRINGILFAEFDTASKLHELKTELASLYDAANELQHKADSAGRSLTASEELAMQNYFAEFEKIESEIKRREKMSAMAQSHGRKTEPGGGQHRQQYGGSFSSGYLRDKPGAKCYPSSHGPIYEISSRTKVSDVLPGTKPEIEFDRWFAAAVLGDRSIDKEAKEYARQLQASVSTSSTGLIIPTVYQPTWIDALRAQSVLVDAGITTVPMPAKSVQWTAVTSDPTAAWHEEAASVSATDPVFASRTLTAKTLAVRTQVSLEAAMDSPDFGAQLSGVFARALAAEVDRAGLHGSGGSGQPSGLLGLSGVGQVTAIGTPSDYDFIIDGLAALLTANNSLDSVNQAVVMSPRTWADLAKLKTGISSDNTPLMRPKAIENTRFLTTTNVSNTLQSPAVSSVGFMGDWSQLLMGIRADSNIQILQTSTYASNLLFEIIGFIRVDFLAVRPASFVTLEGITSS